MLTVACVLKTSDAGEYRAHHVAHLWFSVRKHLTIPYRFVCLTDDDEVPAAVRVPIKEPWPGWWAKIGLFDRERFPGPVFYLDLDTVLVGNIDDIVLGHTWTVLRNFWVPANHPRIGSGLMAWNVDLSALYEKFRADPASYMAASAPGDNWGDQGFIAHHWPFPAARWQVKHPGRVVSYKLGCVNGRPPAGASVICFHGQPRPWATQWWGSNAAI